MIFATFSYNRSALTFYFHMSKSSNKLLNGNLFAQVVKGEYYLLVEELGQRGRITCTFF